MKNWEQELLIRTHADKWRICRRRILIGGGGTIVANHLQSAAIYNSVFLCVGHKRAPSSGNASTAQRLKMRPDHLERLPNEIYFEINQRNWRPLIQTQTKTAWRCLNEGQLAVNFPRNCFEKKSFRRKPSLIDCAATYCHELGETMATRMEGSGRIYFGFWQKFKWKVQVAPRALGSSLLCSTWGRPDAGRLTKSRKFNDQVLGELWTIYKNQNFD